MIATRKDRDVVRSLAREVADIAAKPVQQETIRQWKALNGLRPIRPMVRIDQVCWHEMDVDRELVPRTKDEFCRGIETTLRQTLYCWKHMRGDMVVEPWVDVPKVIASTGFGIRKNERTTAIDPRNHVVSHLYLDQLANDEDVEKIHSPVISLDERATAEAEERAHEILDGFLGVRMQGRTPVFSPVDTLVTWRGAENLLLDLADRPDFIHRIIRRLVDAMQAMLDQFEEQGLLAHDQTIIHCTGAYTDELPAQGYNPQRPRARDIWTFGNAQTFSSVSPAMHKEFEIDYGIRWYERFGLGYYGCCEPLHKKIDIIRALPHVRKISMSPWVDVEQGAEAIGGDYVFSRKPAPFFLAADKWNPQAVEADLRATVEACARHGCPLEIILKDLTTVRYQPQRLWEWADIARRVVGGGDSQ